MEFDVLAIYLQIPVGLLLVSSKLTIGFQLSTGSVLLAASQ